MNGFSAVNIGEMKMHSYLMFFFFFPNESFSKLRINHFFCGMVTRKHFLSLPLYLEWNHSIILAVNKCYRVSVFRESVSHEVGLHVSNIGDWTVYENGATENHTSTYIFQTLSNILYISPANRRSWISPRSLLLNITYNI